MKKLALTFFLAVIMATGFAQTVKFGLKAGLNLSNQSLSEPNVSLDGKNLAGFHAGAILDIGLRDLSIQPGIIFSTKGYRQSVLMSDNQGHLSTAIYKTTLNYIEIPVNVLYHIHAAPGMVIYLGGGPYLAYGVSASGSGPGLSYKIKFGNAGNEYNDPDYGLNFVAGTELAKRFLIDISYGLGLGNLSQASDAKLHNRVIGLSVGYLFR